MRKVLYSLQLRLIIGFAAILALALDSVSYYVGQAAEREAESMRTMRNEIRRAESKDWFPATTLWNSNGRRFSRP